MKAPNPIRSFFAGSNRGIGGYYKKLQFLSLITETWVLFTQFSNLGL